MTASGAVAGGSGSRAARPFLTPGLAPRTVSAASAARAHTQQQSQSRSPSSSPQQGHTHINNARGSEVPSLLENNDDVNLASEQELERPRGQSAVYGAEGLDQHYSSRSGSVVVGGGANGRVGLNHGQTGSYSLQQLHRRLVTGTSSASRSPQPPANYARAFTPTSADAAAAAAIAAARIVPAGAAPLSAAELMGLGAGATAGTATIGAGGLPLYNRSHRGSVSAVTNPALTARLDFDNEFPDDDANDAEVAAAVAAAVASARAAAAAARAAGGESDSPSPSHNSSSHRDGDGERSQYSPSRNNAATGDAGSEDPNAVVTAGAGPRGSISGRSRAGRSVDSRAEADAMMAARLGRLSPSGSAAGSAWSLSLSEAEDHRVYAAKQLLRAGIQVANTPLRPPGATGAGGESTVTSPSTAAGYIMAMEDIARKHVGFSPIKHEKHPEQGQESHPQ